MYASCILIQVPAVRTDVFSRETASFFVFVNYIYRMKLKALLEKDLFIAAVLNLAVLLLSIFVCGVHYSSLDDYFMHSVLTGAYGSEYDVHTYFVNAMYGYLLKPFYVLFPTVGWYSFFETMAVFLSFTAICHVLLRRCGRKLGLALSALVLVCVSPDFYLHVAFTQCAGILTATGIFLFVVGSEERRVRYLVIACLFLAGGVIFRDSMFLLGMPTLAALLFFSLLRARKVWKGTLVALLVVFGTYQGLKEFNTAHFKSDGYDYYAAYQGVRSYFGDGAFYDGDAFSAELDERGIGSRNFRYLRSWYFYDNNVFHLDSMRHLINIAERYHYEPNYVKMPFAVLRAISDSLLRGSVWCWALVCLALIFFSNRKAWWVPWFSFVLIAIPYTYLLLVNRVVGHVESGIWIFVILFVLFFVDKQDILEKKQTKSFIQIIYLVCLASLVIGATNIAFDKVSRTSSIEAAKQPDWPGFLQYAKEHHDDVFLLPFTRYKEMATRIGNTHEAIAPGSLDNIHSTGYWNMHLPAIEGELKKRGVTNLFRDVKKDNVYVIGDGQAMSFAPFYSDHYHEKLSIDTLRYFGDMPLLKYRLEEQQ